MEKEIKPTVYLAMPCYDSVKINTMLSVIKLVQQLSKSGIKVGIWFNNFRRVELKSGLTP